MAGYNSNHIPLFPMKTSSTGRRFFPIWFSRAYVEPLTLSENSRVCLCSKSLLKGFSASARHMVTPERPLCSCVDESSGSPSKSPSHALTLPRPICSRFSPLLPLVCSLQFDSNWFRVCSLHLVRIRTMLPAPRFCPKRLSRCLCPYHVSPCISLSTSKATGFCCRSVPFRGTLPQTYSQTIATP